MRTFNVQSMPTMSLSALILSGSCSLSYADSDYFAGDSCSQSDKTTGEQPFRTGRDDLLASLAANVPLHGGFYKSAAGQGSSKVYGVVQCRGDFSAMIVPTAATMPLERHRMSAQMANRSPCGIVDGPSTGLFNETDNEIPSVAPRGIVFMGELTTTAPEQPLIFQVAVLDVGEGGTRYGLAQCRRDISESDCVKCSDNQMVGFSTMIANKRGWEILASGCNLGYQDYQFYSNISDLTNTNSNGDSRPATGSDVTSMTVVGLNPLIFL